MQTVADMRGVGVKYGGNLPTSFMDGQVAKMDSLVIETGDRVGTLCVDLRSERA